MRKIDKFSGNFHPILSYRDFTAAKRDIAMIFILRCNNFVYSINTVVFGVEKAFGISVGTADIAVYTTKVATRCGYYLNIYCFQNLEPFLVVS